MNFDSYSTTIRDQFKDTSDTTKRAIALAACKLAASRLIPDDLLVQAALRALEAGRYIDAELTKKLEEHAYDLDDQYFAAQEAYRAGRTDEKTYEEMRAKARAAESVFSAFDRDPTAAMSNAVYVACAALGVAPVKAEIDAVIAQAPPRH
ncbi:MAG TPA: hypothetical protein VGR79_04305 [Stellaceae bacterium]|nr:hypothetical protein [Stellaceae bacterium]